MTDRNPSLYLQSDAGRTRPAADLLSRIAHLQAEHVADLGYGPGNNTRPLCTTWPLATITDIDNSPAMLAQAAQALPDCEFTDADTAHWWPAQSVDMIYASASPQQLADHETLFPHLVAQLAVNGTLAVQMPNNWQEPSHTLMRRIADEQESPDRGRQPLLPPNTWYDMLTHQGYEVDIWRIIYFHPLTSHQAINDWLQGTELRPYLAGPDEQSRNAFLTRYAELLAEHYPLWCNGKVLLRLPRLFIVTRKIDV